jgi:hypothetical protein
MDPSTLLARLNNLENSWSSLDAWLKFWIVLVVIGVAIELVVVVKEYRDDRHEWLRGIVRPPDRPSRWLLFWNLLGAGFVAIGVAGEFAIHLNAGKIETDIRSVTRELVAIANKEGKEAGALAASATLEAAMLGKEADLLRIKLANSSIPRTLEEAAQKRIAATLPRRSTGGQVNVMYLPWAFDGLALARQILGALGKAGISNPPQIDVTSLERCPYWFCIATLASICRGSGNAHVGP